MTQPPALSANCFPSRRPVWILLSVLAAIEIGFAWWLGGLPLLDARLAYTPAEAADLVRGLAPSSRDRYRLFSIADLAFIALYSATLVMWLRLLLRCTRKPGPWLPWVGLLPGSCNAIETVGVAVLLEAGSLERTLAVWCVVFATPLKWATAAAVAVLIATLELAARRGKARGWARWVLQTARPRSLQRPCTPQPFAVDASTSDA